jgi:hypothetical protein
LALQGDGPRTEPTQSYTAPAYTAPNPVPPPVPAPVLDLVPEAPAQTPVADNGGGRQSGRTQIDSAPQVPSQSSGTGDRGGSKSAGGERRGARGD